MIKLTKSWDNITHGGNLHQAIQRYGIEHEQWLDLSTGISPWSWPVKSLPPTVWQDLPPPINHLLDAAAHYYQCNIDSIVATPGSQMAIRLLPHLFKATRVAMPILGYQEHAHSWQQAGNSMIYYSNQEELLSLVMSGEVEHAVLINPNNPTCETTQLSIIESIVNHIQGILVIDEAFMDLYNHDISDHANTIKSAIELNSNKVIVLRSVGKFFGLAGIRIGFAISPHPILKQLNALLQPWAISHASQYIATQALQDSSWQNMQRERIAIQEAQMRTIIEALLIQHLSDYSMKSSGLFITVFGTKHELKTVHQALAKKAIWTRLYNNQDCYGWLRFSLITCLNRLQQRLFSSF